MNKIENKIENKVEKPVVLINHKNDNFQTKFNLKIVEAVDTSGEFYYVYLKEGEGYQEEVHLFRITCAITFHQQNGNFYMCIG